MLTRLSRNSFADNSFEPTLLLLRSDEKFHQTTNIIAQISWSVFIKCYEDTP
jgi:hypothetical protein